MAKPKGHQPQHATDYHVQPKVTPKKSSSKTRANSIVARGTGMKPKGGTGMAGKHC